ncbi:MAG: DUF2953 domain-containing protein [Clostridia bacterium]|nr:DUF2953 domain-containing protein [Clostridia bacterium]
MTAFLILFSILLILTLILLIRIRVTIDYKGEDIKLKLHILGIPITLLPKKQKKKKIRISDYSYKNQQKKLKKPKKQKPEKEKKKSKEEKLKEKPPLSEAIPMIADIVKYLLGKFFGHLRIDVTEIKITVGSDDAAKTAILFGIINQAAAALFDLLGSITNVKKNRKNEIGVYADFTSEKTVININLGFSLRIWHVFSIALGTLFRYLKNMLKGNK